VVRERVSNDHKEQQFGGGRGYGTLAGRRSLGFPMSKARRPAGARARAPPLIADMRPSTGWKTGGNAASKNSDFDRGTWAWEETAEEVRERRSPEGIESGSALDRRIGVGVWAGMGRARKEFMLAARGWVLAALMVPMGLTGRPSPPPPP